jgi:hypothetical protein
MTHPHDTRPDLHRIRTARQRDRLGLLDRTDFDVPELDLLLDAAECETVSADAEQMEPERWDGGLT